MVERLPKLQGFLKAVLPEYIPLRGFDEEMEPREHLIQDVFAGVKEATMSIRLT